MASKEDHLALAKGHVEARNIFEPNISFYFITPFCSSFCTSYSRNASSSSRNATFSNPNAETMFSGLKSVIY